ncbi:LytTR family transcriptional regulator DNA-binding domain-containing protein [Paenibacillus beijingensis]|uniref:HTH LytTR-type domain-containing protein n=1 Tax=Paenibacillus beijingensis TaxID=1126833 RepID=A0A0D5NKH6_9BACL|nr:LytTR family transcriptional regulator DNA-binding domain-containing protein [Paenibacillus beijingensis]AJY75854.1 hypothetical protein VN24_16435 [Paenibacillus beijingensis]
MKLPLLDKNGAPHSVDIDDVLTIKPTTRGPEFHTATGIYTFPTTTNELISLFNKHGFQKVDRCSIINMDKAVLFDAKQRKVYFDGESAEGSVIYATVSEHNAGKLKHLIREDFGIQSYGSRSWINRLSHHPTGPN